MPAPNVQKMKNFYRGKKSQGLPKFDQNSNRYNSKPEVEIDFAPTPNFMVSRGLKSA